MLTLPQVHVHDRVNAGNDQRTPASAAVHDSYARAGYQPEASSQLLRLGAEYKHSTR